MLDSIVRKESILNYISDFICFLFIITFGLPISILIFVYASIGLHLWRNKIPGNPEMIRDSAKWQQKIKIIKMFNQSISVASHQCVASFCIPNMDLNLKKSSSSESSSLEKYDDKCHY